MPSGTPSGCVERAPVGRVPGSPRAGFLRPFGPPGDVPGTDRVRNASVRRSSHPAQPWLGGARPLEQGHGRDITPTGLLGSGDGLLKRTASGQVDQQGSQQDGGIGKASGTPQRPQAESLLLPPGRQELSDQRPIIQLANMCMEVHSRKNTGARPRWPSLELTGQVPPHPDQFCATTSRSVPCKLE
jgi:hypothetical protein